MIQANLKIEAKDFEQLLEAISDIKECTKIWEPMIVSKGLEYSDKCSGYKYEISCYPLKGKEGC